MFFVFFLEKKNRKETHQFITRSFFPLYILYWLEQRGDDGGGGSETGTEIKKRENRSILKEKNARHFFSSSPFSSASSFSLLATAAAAAAAMPPPPEPSLGNYTGLCDKERASFCSDAAESAPRSGEEPAEEAVASASGSGLVEAEEGRECGERGRGGGGGGGSGK